MPSLFKSVAGKDEILSLCDEKLRELNIDYQSKIIDTSYGKTNIIITNIATSDQALLVSRLQAHLDAAVTKENPGILLHVSNPKSGLSWSGAAGVSDKQSNTELQPDQTFGWLT